ncbi:MAG: hypothetical protein A2Y65_10330 [Deltaproteobacteria bacterium RBG_13_52_11]|nr:MAG: hypothetical protein A2Y65_10330 [Deltaproteobacteria bacterium RBG_13_52_11]
MKDEELMERLLEEDEEFRQLKEEHNWFHRKVEDLDKKAFLTPAERLKREELKKRKLALKDKMEEIMAAHRRRLEGKE